MGGSWQFRYDETGVIGTSREGMLHGGPPSESFEDLDLSDRSPNSLDKLS